MPLAAINAHYLTTDVPTSLAVAACLLLTVEGTRRGPRWFVAAGVAAGVAASMKYNGGFVVGVPVLTYLLSMWRLGALGQPSDLRHAGRDHRGVRDRVRGAHARGRVPDVGGDRCPSVAGRAIQRPCRSRRDGQLATLLGVPVG